MYRKLLYPVDGSSHAREAMPHVVALARAMDASVLVVQVVEIVTEADAVTVPERKAEADASVAGIAATLRAEGVTVEAPRVIEGDAGRSIVEAAREYDADLIVMSTRGNSGLVRLVLGSVAEDVMTHASCPVLLVRPRRDG